LRKQLDSQTKDKNSSINPISSQSQSCDESLKCPEVIDELVSHQIMLQLAGESKVSSQENESYQIHCGEGAKNSGAFEMQAEGPDSSFLSVGLKMTISPNIPKDKLEGLSSLLESTETKYNSGAVAVASMVPKQSNN
jgi:hypothetical protein